MEGATAYLRYIGASDAMIKLNAKLLAALDDPYMPYYRAVGEVDAAYVRAINGSVLLLDRAVAWQKSKSSADKAEAIAGYRAYQQAIAVVKDAREIAEDAVLATAATRESPTWSLRLPSHERLAKALRSFSRKFAARDTKLLSTGSITLEQHATMLRAFEDFTLLAALYRESPSSALKTAAKAAFARAYEIYRTPVKARILTPTPAVPVSPAPVAEPVRTLGAVFALPETAAPGGQSEGIRTLQSVLQAYGYFSADLQTTGYYGPVTVSAMAKFSSAVLGIDNPQGLYTPTVRDAMRALRYDPSKFTN